MKQYILYPVLLFMILLASCQKDEESFDNKVFIEAPSNVGDILLKGNTNDLVRKIQVAIPKPNSVDVSVVYDIDESLVSVYNKAYYDNAIILPAENYELEDNSVEIAVGNVLSKETSLIFKNLKNLDREIVYVLPVTIASANIEILNSARTFYYVFKGAALINVVGDIEENYLTVNWTKPEVCENMNQLTMEVLVRIKNYDRMISTVMGIEGGLLMRLGDAGFPSNQIQVATTSGNFPDGDTKKGLPTDEWVHIALTYDSSNGEMIVYVNGAKQSEAIKSLGAINLAKGGVDGFCIGRSYADDRYLAGEISECRIWNVVRSAEEIAANPYYVDNSSDGLVAYWKFDDESALSIEDHTGNGNNAVANKTMRWSPVSLPEASK